MSSCKTRLLLAMSLAMLSACATPLHHSGRFGLLDRLDEGSSKGSRSSRDGSIRTINEEDLAQAPDPSAVLKLSGEWQWPLQSVEPSSSFGERGRKFHQGVDLRAPMNTPVYACADGEVVYVGSKIRGYGRMVVLKHPGNLFTVYAHHNKNFVRSGQTVSRGDRIALSGKSGHAHGPHLHFEIRKGTVSYDPELAFNDYSSTNTADRKFASATPATSNKRSAKGKSRRASRSRKATRNAKIATSKNHSPSGQNL